MKEIFLLYDQTALLHQRILQDSMILISFLKS